MFRIFITGFFLSLTAIIWAWIIVLAVFEDTFIGPLLDGLPNKPSDTTSQQLQSSKDFLGWHFYESDYLSEFSVINKIADKGNRPDFAMKDIASGQISFEGTRSVYKVNTHQAVDKGPFQLLINSLPNALILSTSKSKMVTSPFSKKRYHPILGKLLPHKGIDVGAPEGTPVMAVADGEIAFVGTKPKSGRFIKIAHGPSKETRYLHLSGFSSLAKVGRKIFAGDVIGYVGQSGLTTGPHLHFEVWIGGKAVSPHGHHVFELAPTKPPLWKCYERLVYQVLAARRINSLEMGARENKSSWVEDSLLASVSFKDGSFSL